MKSFEVGQRVWRVCQGGTLQEDLQEGAVVSVSPTGASVRVKWGWIPGPIVRQHYCYLRWEQNKLLTDTQAAAWRETNGFDRKERAHRSALDTAIDDLRNALNVRHYSTDERIAKIRCATAEVRAMVNRINGGG